MSNDIAMVLTYSSFTRMPRTLQPSTEKPNCLYRAKAGLLSSRASSSTRLIPARTARRKHSAKSDLPNLDHDTPAQAHAKRAAVAQGGVPARHDVAPADDSRLGARNDLRYAVLDIAAHKGPDFLEWRRFEKSKELALTCHGVETGAKGISVFYRDGTNLNVHCGAQRLR
jgi:hypothetical protein